MKEEKTEVFVQTSCAYLVTKQQNLWTVFSFDSFWKVFVTETCLPGSASVGSRYYKSVAVA